MATAILAPEALSNRVKVYGGTHTTVAAEDAVTITAMSQIISATATFNTDPADANLIVSCAFSGNILTIKTWKTDGADPTPVAASSFSKVVNYIVLGY